MYFTQQLRGFILRILVGHDLHAPFHMEAAEMRISMVTLQLEGGPEFLC